MIHDIIELLFWPLVLLGAYLGANLAFWWDGRHMKSRRTKND